MEYCGLADISLSDYLALLHTELVPELVQTQILIIFSWSNLFLEFHECAIKISMGFLFIINIVLKLQSMDMPVL